MDGRPAAGFPRRRTGLSQPAHRPRKGAVASVGSPSLVSTRQNSAARGGSRVVRPIRTESALQARVVCRKPCQNRAVLDMVKGRESAAGPS